MIRFDDESQQLGIGPFKALKVRSAVADGTGGVFSAVLESGGSGPIAYFVFRFKYNDTPVVELPVLEGGK
jgi:hypothetical protein